MKDKQASSQQPFQSVSPMVMVGNIITLMGLLQAAVIIKNTHLA